MCPVLLAGGGGMNMNLYAKLNERSARVTRELMAQSSNELSDSTETEYGDFDNAKWLNAELDSLREQRETVMDIMTVTDAVEASDN